MSGRKSNTKLANVEEVTVLKHTVVCPDEMCRPETNNNRRAPEEYDGSRNRTD